MSFPPCPVLEYPPSSAVMLGLSAPTLSLCRVPQIAEIRDQKSFKHAVQQQTLLVLVERKRSSTEEDVENELSKTKGQNKKFEMLWKQIQLVMKVLQLMQFKILNKGP